MGGGRWILPAKLNTEAIANGQKECAPPPAFGPLQLPKFSNILIHVNVVQSLSRERSRAIRLRSLRDGEVMEDSDQAFCRILCTGSNVVFWGGGP